MLLLSQICVFVAVFFSNLFTVCLFLFFKPPPPVGAGGGYMFSGRPSVRASVRPSVRASVRDSRGSFMFLRYLQYLLTDFRQTFVTGASWDTDDLSTFLDQKVKVQGHTIAAEAHNTRRYRRVQLFLVSYCILFCDYSSLPVKIEIAVPAHAR